MKKFSWRVLHIHHALFTSARKSNIILALEQHVLIKKSRLICMHAINVQSHSAGTVQWTRMLQKFLHRNTRLWIIAYISANSKLEIQSTMSACFKSCINCPKNTSNAAKHANQSLFGSVSFINLYFVKNVLPTQNSSKSIGISTHRCTHTHWLLIL